MNMSSADNKMEKADLGDSGVVKLLQSKGLMQDEKTMLIADSNCLGIFDPNPEILGSKKRETSACACRSPPEDGTFREIPWCDVLSVEPQRDLNRLTVHYIQSSSKKVLRAKTLDIVLEDGNVDKWIEVIKQQLELVPGRPKKLLAIVNPVSGSSKAKQLYEKHAASLFSLANIDVTVKETEGPKHAMEIGEQADTSSYDGIVCVGGDGVFQNVLQGLFVQTQRQAKVDINNSSATWAKPFIPIGCLPAGSGNCISQSCNDGVIDMETAVLRVIKGKQNRGTAYVAHSKATFVCIGGLGFAYGIFSDMIVKREGMRSWGTLGLPISVLSVLLRKKRAFRCHLEYLQGEQVHLNGKGEYTDEVETEMPSGEWKKYDSKDLKMSSIHSFNSDLIDVGDHCISHPFGRNISLCVDTGCSTISFMKHFATLSGKKTGPLANIDFLPNVKAFRISLERDETETSATASAARAKERKLEDSLEVDGELFSLEVPQMEVRVLTDFIPLYSCLPEELSQLATKLI